MCACQPASSSSSGRRQAVDQQFGRGSADSVLSGSAGGEYCCHRLRGGGGGDCGCADP
jgi:hypothetical protein